MTALSDIKAIAPSANAKVVVAAKATDITSLMALMMQHCSELQAIVRQVIAVYPTTVADATMLTQLNSILTEIL